MENIERVGEEVGGDAGRKGRKEWGRVKMMTKEVERGKR